MTWYVEVGRCGQQSQFCEFVGIMRFDAGHMVVRDFVIFLIRLRMLKLGRA